VSERKGLPPALSRPLAIAWKDLLVLGKGANALKGAFGALIFLLPILGLAALAVYVPGPWRYAGRALGLGVSAIFSALAFLVALPAATSLALERDRDTLQGLVVSPAEPRDLILGKLLAALTNSLGAKALALPALAFAYALGGVEAGFIPRYILVLFAADLSFASFALYATARPLRAPRLGSPAFKLGVSQAQLAVQRSLGVVVLISLVPIYSALFILPLALQHGVKLGHVLDTVAPLGALHPLFALIAWGDAQIFGRAVPVWALAVTFHVLLAFPFLAAAAEAQRPPGAPRGRAPRLGYLVLFAFVVAMATGSSSEAGPEAHALVGSVVAAIFLVFGATGFSQSPPPRRPFGRSEVLRAFVDPSASLVSSAETSPGFAFHLALVATPFLLLAAPREAALRTAFGLAAAAIGLSAIGARLGARAQRKDAEALERAIAANAVAGVKRSEIAEGKEAAEEPATHTGAVLGLVSVFVVLAPLLAFAGMELAKRITQLEPLVPVLRGIAVLGVIANPFTALEPLLESGTAGPFVTQAATTLTGLEPWVLATLHLIFWVLVSVIALATLRRVREVGFPARATG
jgi:hypothetical protein